MFSYFSMFIIFCNIHFWLAKGITLHIYVKLQLLRIPYVSPIGPGGIPFSLRQFVPARSLIDSTLSPEGSCGSLDANRRRLFSPPPQDCFLGNLKIALTVAYIRSRRFVWLARTRVTIIETGAKKHHYSRRSYRTNLGRRRRVAANSADALEIAEKRS